MGESFIIHVEDIIADFVPKEVAIITKNLIVEYFSIHNCKGKNMYTGAMIQNDARTNPDSTTFVQLFSGLLPVFRSF